MIETLLGEITTSTDKSHINKKKIINEKTLKKYIERERVRERKREREHFTTFICCTHPEQKTQGRQSAPKREERKPHQSVYFFPKPKHKKKEEEMMPKMGLSYITKI